MTQEGLQRALIDLGWMTLIHRALGGKPSASFTLYILMRRAGRPQTYAMLAESYAAFTQSGGAVSHRGSPQGHSEEGVKKRVERARAALSDLGIENAIRTVALDRHCGGGYVLEKSDLPLVEAALLEAAGFELEAA